MSDEQRKAKDEAGLEEASPDGGITDSTEGDTEGHRRHFRQPAPAMPGRPGPGEAASNEDASGAEPDEFLRR